MSSEDNKKNENKSVLKKENSPKKSQKNSTEAVLNFIQANLKYIAGAAVLVILIVVLLVYTGKQGGNSGSNAADTTEISGAEGTYEVDSNEEINTLITNYFNAYANGDTDTIATLATPLSDLEKSYISMYSQYVEAYQSIRCYTKQGLDDKSYLVSVYLEMKFAGVDTVAPGLSFFYVQTNDDGSLYINNAYSYFNLNMLENNPDAAYPLDDNVKKLIDKFEKQDDVVALLADVQSKYETALSADANLATMANTTLADAYNAWAATINSSAPAAEADTTAQAETPATEASAAESVPEAETPAAETPAAETPADTSGVTAANDTVYALDTVNIRSEANESGSVVGRATVGTSFTRTGTTADGWSQVEYNGTTAYIKSDYLTTDASQTSGQSQNTVAAGESVRLSDTTNIRSSMSETADRVGVAYSGETVKVIESYAEGWSKVEWNGKTGYIKTDLLQ